MRVLLTRPEAQSQELGSELSARGIDWFDEPLLRIVPVSWDRDVLEGRPALLLTSPNASRELLRISGVRRDTTIFAVGPGTAAPLRAAGFSDVHAAGGTAVDLIAYVRRHADPRAGRLLYLSGFDITLDPAIGLAPAGFTVDRVVVYRAVAVESLGAEVMRDIVQNRFDAAVFLSVRTAAVFCNLAIAAGIVDACERMIAVAISEKVAEALKPAGFRQSVVAASPSLDGVIDAILRVRAGNI